jgi:hypothetical protein
MSGRPSLRTRKRDSGTARRLHYFGTGGQLVGVGARVSRARAPDGWRRSVRSGEPARHEQGSAGGSASSASPRKPDSGISLARLRDRPGLTGSAGHSAATRSCFINRAHFCLQAIGGEAEAVPEDERAQPIDIRMLDRLETTLPSDPNGG